MSTNMSLETKKVKDKPTTEILPADKLEAAKKAKEQYISDLEKDNKLEILEMVLDPKSTAENILSLLEEYSNLKIAIAFADINELNDTYKGNSALQLAIIHKRFDLIPALVKVINECRKTSSKSEYMFSYKNSKDKNVLDILMELHNEENITKVAKIIFLEISSTLVQEFLNSPSVVAFLKSAMQKKYIDLVTFLIQHPDFGPYTHQPLEMAIETDCLAALQCCNKPHLMDINLLNKETDLTPLMQAVVANKIEFVEQLLTNPTLLINKQNKKRKSALHYALDVKELNEKMVSLLIQHGSDYTLSDASNVTCENLAVSKGFIEKLKKIIIDNKLKVKSIPEAKRSAERKRTQEKELPQKEALHVILGPFKKRAGLIKNVFVDLRLNGHINNDHSLNGKKSEGMNLQHTTAFVMEMLNLMTDGTLKQEFKTEKESITIFQNKLKMLSEYSTLFTNVMMSSFYKIKAHEFETEKRDKLIQKNTHKLATLCFEDFKKNKTICIPGGWVSGSRPGHALVLEFTENTDKDVIFSAYNSGSGLEYHESFDGPKTKYNPKFSFVIPGKQKEEIVGFLQSLICFQFSPFWENKNQSAKSMYGLFFDFRYRMQAKITSASSKAIDLFITPQRSGTCAYNVLRSLSKCLLSREEDQFLDFESKLQSIIEFFSTEFLRGNLGRPEINQQLQDGLSNLSRIVSVCLEDQEKNGNIKYQERLVEITALLERISNTLKIEAHSATFVEELFNVNECHFLQPIRTDFTIDDRYSFYSGVESLKVTQAHTTYDYPTSFTLTAPLADLKKLKELVSSFEKEQNKSTQSILSRKTIEMTLLQLPLPSKENDEYWKSLKHCDCANALSLLANIQRKYLFYINSKTEACSPSQIVAVYMFFALKDIIAKKYFVEKYGNFSHAKTAEAFSVFRNLFARNVFSYIHKGTLDKKFRELDSYFWGVYGSKSPEISFKRLIQENNLSESELFELSKPHHNEIIELLSQSNKKNRNVVNKNETFLFLVLKHRPKNFEKIINKTIQDEYNTLFLVEQLASDLMIVFNLDYRNEHILSTSLEKQKNYPRLDVIDVPKGSDVTIQWQFREQVSRTSYLDKGTYDERTPIARLHLTPPAPKGESSRPSMLDRFKIESLIKAVQSERSKFTSNNIHAFEGDKMLTPERAIEQETLHLFNDSPNVSITMALEFYLSNLSLLQDIHYQTLLTTRLFSPGVLTHQLLNGNKNLKLINNVVHFLKKAYSYYYDNKTVAYPIHYIFKIAFILQSYLHSILKQVGEPYRNEIEGHIRDIKHLTFQIYGLLNVVDPTSQAFKASLDKRKRIVFGRLLYCNLLQELELKLELLSDNASLMDKEAIIAQYLICRFNIEMLDEPTENPIEGIDPLLRDVASNLKFCLTPLLKDFFEKKDKKSIAEFLLTRCLPEAIKQRLENEMEFEFSFPWFKVGKKPQNIDDKDDRYYINLENGSVQKQGFSPKQTPSWVLPHLRHDLFKEVNFDNIAALVNSNNSSVKFLLKNDEYHISQSRNSSSIVEIKKTFVFQGKTLWFHLLEYNKASMKNLPAFLCDKDYILWASSHAITEGQTRTYLFYNLALQKVTHVLMDNRLFTWPLDEKASKELLNIQGSKHLTDIVMLGFFQRFEHASFIEFSKKTSDKESLAIHFPRYGFGFSLKSNDGSLSFIFSENDNYKLSSTLHTRIIPGFSSYLELVPCVATTDSKTFLLIPRLPFVSIAAYQIDLDKAAMAITDELALEKRCIVHDGSPIDSTQWKLKNQGNYYKILLGEDGYLEANTAEEALYLCYVCAATCNAELAEYYFKLYKKLNGLITGSRSEAEIIYWFLKDIPYQMSSSSIIKAFVNFSDMQKSNILAYPELCAIRMQLLAMLCFYSSAQCSFSLTSEQEVANTNWDNNVKKSLKSFFNVDSLKKQLKDVMQQYVHAENYIPISLKLTHPDLCFMSCFMDQTDLPYALAQRHYNARKFYSEKTSTIDNKFIQRYFSLPQDKPVKKMTVFGTIESILVIDKYLSVDNDLAYELKNQHWAKGKNIPMDDFIEGSATEHEFAYSFCKYYKSILSLGQFDQAIIALKERLCEFLSMYLELKPFATVSDSQILSLENSTVYLATILVYLIEYPDHFRGVEIFEGEEIGFPSDHFNHEKFSSIIIGLCEQKPIRLPALGLKPILLGDDSKRSSERKLILDTPFPLKLDEAPKSLLPSVKDIKMIADLALDKPSVAEGTLETKSEKESKILFEGFDERDYLAGKQQNKTYRNFKQQAFETLNNADIREQLTKMFTGYIIEHAKQMTCLRTNIENLFNSTGKEPLVVAKNKLSTMGRTKICFSIDDIVQLIVKNELSAVAKRDTSLDEKDLKNILRLAAEYLLGETTLQFYRRTLKILEEIKQHENQEAQFRDSITKLARSLISTRSYDYKTFSSLSSFFACLNFERSENILIRTSQMNIIKDLSKKSPDGKEFENILFQITMGAGKTTVIMPVTVHEKAEGNNLNVVCVPKGLLATQRKDLQRTSSRTVGQNALPVHFERRTDCSVPNLKRLFLYMIHCMVNRDYFVCTNTVFPSIRLKSLELLSNSKDSVQKGIMKNIVQVMYHTHVLFDESDQLSPDKELNFDTSGKPTHFRSETIADILNVISHLQFVSFEYLGKKWKLTDILSDDFPTPVDFKWEEFFTTKLIEPLTDLLLSHETSAIAKLAKKLKDKAKVERLKLYISGKAESIPDFLFRLTENEKHLVGMVKGLISSLLLQTLAKQLGKQYGKSKKQLNSDMTDQSVDQFLIEEMAIPYVANGIPNEGSEHACPYAKLLYTILYNMKQGVSDKVLKLFIQTFQTQALEERAMRPGVFSSLNETLAGRKFKLISKMDLASIDLKNVEEFSAFKSEFSLSHNLKVIIYSLMHLILSRMIVRTATLRHNAFNNQALSRTVQVGSATISSPFMFDQRLRFDHESARGTNGRTLDLFISKKTQLYCAKTNDHFKEICSIIEQNPKISCIIDEGALCGQDNFAAALKFSKIFQSKTTRDIKYIIFFDVSDRVCALPVNVEHRKLIYIDSTDPDKIQKVLGCHRSNYIVFLDELRALGIDFKFEFDAEAVATSCIKSKLLKSIQAWGRMRGFVDDQKIGVFIPKSMQDAYPNPDPFGKPEDQWTHSFFLSILQKNQNQDDIRLNFKSAIDKIKNVIRHDLLTLMDNIPYEALEADFRLKLSPILDSFSKDEPLDVFGQCVSKTLTKEIFKNECEKFLKLWQWSINEYQSGLSKMDRSLRTLSLEPTVTQKSDIEQRLKIILEQAPKVCDEYTMMQRDNNDTEVEVVLDSKTLAEVNKETNKKTDSKTLNETATFSSSEKVIAVKHSPLKNFDLSTFRLEQYTDITGMRQIESLNIKIVLQPRERTNGPSLNFRFDDNIFVSRRYYETYRSLHPVHLIGSHVKPLHYILFLQEKTRDTQELILKALFITAEEAGFLYDLMQNKEQIEALADVNRDIWITTPHELHFAGEKPKNVLPIYKVLLNQARLFNFNIEIIAEEIDDQKQGKERLELISAFRILLPRHPHKLAAFDFLESQLRCSDDDTAFVTGSHFVAGPASGRQAEVDSTSSEFAGGAGSAAGQTLMLPQFSSQRFSTSAVSNQSSGLGLGGTPASKKN